MAAVALFLFAASAASADDVVSAGPDKVAVTIYRDGPVATAGLAASDNGLALITETRIVDVPAGRSRVLFEGVADGIVPQSAAIEGLPAGVVERNFDYDLLDPASMLARSVGETVTLRRIDARTGKVSEERAIVRSAPEGTVLQTDHGFEALHCSGGAEALVFDHMPKGLAARPVLSALADAQTAGRYTVTLSYLSVRLNWSADYVAKLAPDGRSLALGGWITLANSSQVSFANAPTAVVAGHLSRVAVEIARPNAKAVELACWPNQTTHAGWIYPPPPPPPLPPPQQVPMPAPASTAVVTAYKREVRLQKVALAIQSQLGDYKLYTLAQPTTVAALQTKQVAFLDQPNVTFERVYAVAAASVGASVGDQGVQAATATLRFQNTAAKGLGVALPQGTVWLRQQRASGGELFVGSKTIDDVAKDAPFEIAVGPASDVTAHLRMVDRTLVHGGRDSMSFAAEITNAKPVPVTVEIRQPGVDAFVNGVVSAESQPHGTKGGDPVWSVRVPANTSETLTYTLEYDD
ncbi:MAG TPA: hypothetical protein VKT30_16785 [Caulobacteraceae bacterium]|nr:hypothetical protein [Caulobacteraceae bacterium]